MNYFIANFDFALGISSIGLDGEELDQVNFMEKPEIFVRKGDYVASAEDTLINFTCRYEIVKETDIYTSIGKIVIVKIKENGKALVAGPARVNDMLMVVSILNEFLDVGKILIDGAFSRQVFSKVTQATVLVIGANYDRNIDNVVDNAKSLYNKFNLPIITNFPFSFSEKIQLLTNSNNLKLLDYSSIIGKVEDFFNEDLEKLNESIKAYLLKLSYIKLEDEDNGILEKYYNSKSYYGFIRDEYSVGFVSPSSSILLITKLQTENQDESRYLEKYEKIDLTAFESKKELQTLLNNRNEELKIELLKLKEYIKSRYTLNDLI
ncbi:MAG: hypothetical protein WCS32_00970 [Candidatus Izemoplasmatales bacterium]